MRVTIRTRQVARGIDVHKTCWVDPARIECALVLDGFKDLNPYRDRGRVLGGDWDRRAVRFVDSGIGVYRGLEDRFTRGMDWQDTEFYGRVLDLISNGTPLWGCRNQAEWDDRCRLLDLLFEDMRANGYRSRQDIGKQENDPYGGEDEITLRIGRDGDLLFEDGQHRLAMAKLLHLHRIPVKITIRHRKWCQFRQEVLDHARTTWGKVYHPLTHPDLSDIPSVYGDERFEMIRANLPFNAGDLLDIGSHWGYFCHKLEEEGFNCYAVESNAECHYFLEKCRLAEGRTFKVIYGSILDYREKNDFDVVLALNIFHHFLKAEDTYRGLVELLGRLRMKVMFFQPELATSRQMEGAYRNFGCEEFVEFILDNSMLTESKYIGKTSDNRPIYRLQAV